MWTDDIRLQVIKLRESREWSRPELAKRLKPATSYQQIERLEKGERKLTIEWIEKLADAFGVDAMDLVAPSNERPQRFSLSLPAAEEAASTIALIATGAEPDEGLQTTLALMLQELVETFAANPGTRHDPQQLRPVVDLLARRYARQ